MKTIEEFYEELYFIFHLRCCAEYTWHVHVTLLDLEVLCSLLASTSRAGHRVTCPSRRQLNAVVLSLNWQVLIGQ